MKNEAHVKGNANSMGNTTSDRNFTDQGINQQAGMRNGNTQRPGRESVFKPKKRML